MLDVVARALAYWLLINLSTLLPLALFLRKYVVSTGSYGSHVRIDILEYLVPYHLGVFSSLAWTILFAPFMEEILFFAIPAMLGFWYSVVGLAAWSSVHIARLAYGVRAVPDPVDRWGAVLSYSLFILLQGWLSLWLWSIGCGLLSIALHSMHNVLAVLGLTLDTVRRKRSGNRRRLRNRYWVRT